MSSTKWKAYKVFNYIQLVYSLLFLFFIIIAFIETNNRVDGFSIGFTVLLAIMAVNNYNNLRIMKNYFPDKFIPKQTISWNMALFVICIILNVLLFLVLIVGFLQEFKPENADAGFGKATLVVVSLIVANWVYVCINQLQIISYIKREHNNKMNNTIDSLGQELENMQNR